MLIKPHVYSLTQHTRTHAHTHIVRIYLFKYKHHSWNKQQQQQQVREWQKKSHREVKTIHYQIGIACVSSQSYYTYLASFSLFFFLLIFCRIQNANDAVKKKRIKHIWHICVHTLLIKSAYLNTHTKHTHTHTYSSSLSFALKNICTEHDCHVSHFQQHTLNSIQFLFISVWSVNEFAFRLQNFFDFYYYFFIIFNSQFKSYSQVHL